MHARRPLLTPREGLSFLCDFLFFVESISPTLKARAFVAGVAGRSHPFPTQQRGGLVMHRLLACLMVAACFLSPVVPAADYPPGVYAVADQ